MYAKMLIFVTNLSCIIQYIADNLDESVQLDVYTDFSKTFDRLDHDILF